MKFGNTISLLLACPPYLCAGFATVFLGWSSGKFHERTIHISVGLGFAIVGFITAATTLNTAGRYVACFIFPIGAYSVNGAVVGWIATTLSQSPEKKAVSAVPVLPSPLHRGVRVEPPTSDHLLPHRLRWP